MKGFMRILPVALAMAFGLLSLIGLLFVPVIGETLTAWAAFLAAVALLLGAVNLLGIHVQRLSQGNFYSGVLIFCMLAVLVLAITDFLGWTEEGVESAFNLVQVPLESAMAALLAFFLLFAGFRLLERQRSRWSVLFLVTVVILLLGRTPLPSAVSGIVHWLSDFISTLFVNAGIRGLIIGVALGTIVVSLRVLMGWERPYDK
jgi:hypothetical protein